jgi:hypothetical protein
LVGEGTGCPPARSGRDCAGVVCELDDGTLSVGSR